MKTLLRITHTTFLPALLLLGITLPRPVVAQETIDLVNPSFEEPAGEERDFANIPGWSTDEATEDSGIAPNDNATDGSQAAWSMSNDPTIWQLTDYTIQEGDVITMAVDIRNSWNTTAVDLILYYDDNGTRTPAATETVTFDTQTTEAMEEFTVTLVADDVPEAVGQTLGVEIDNTSAEGAFIELDNVRITKTTGTAIDDEPLVPAQFTLEQNYPNPFNPTTMIDYHLETASQVQVVVYDLLGQPVRTLVQGHQPAGAHSISWDGRDDAGALMASGAYLYRLTVQVEGQGVMHTASRKMLLVK